MNDMKQVAYVLVGLLAGFVLAGAIFVVTRLPGGKPVALEPAPTKAPIAVQVLGDVVRPGVYELPDGARVNDAIDAAGGLIADANTGDLNLAAKLEDGQQIQIGTGGSGSSITSSGPTNSSGTNPGAGGAPFTVLPTTASPTTSAGNRVDINTATVAQLDALPGISPTVAQNIVNYRSENGPFSTIEDIMNVPGIGPATFDTIKNSITTGD